MSRTTRQLVPASGSPRILPNPTCFSSGSNGNYLVAGFVAMGLGVGLEAAQFVGPGDASVGDVLRDALGAGAALLLAASVDRGWFAGRSAAGRWGLRSGAVLLVGLSFVPMLRDAESDKIVRYLAANHRSRQRFRVDGPSETLNSRYGMTILASVGAKPQPFTPSNHFYRPDCDPAPIPLPPGGAVEGNDGYACTHKGDCHLLVVDAGTCHLHEMFVANRTDAEFEGGCHAKWDLKAPYRPELRGECCTSADAGGLPITAHMFSADDIAAGEINHAIRFVLPNKLIRERVYVRPATHSTRATKEPSAAPPYGARIRLRASVDASKLKPAALVVAKALQRYGMILSDGGNLTFTAANDRFTSAKWAEVGFGPNDLTDLQWTDFEVVELGERHRWGRECSCQRQPISN